MEELIARAARLAGWEQSVNPETFVSRTANGDTQLWNPIMNRDHLWALLGLVEDKVVFLFDDFDLSIEKTATGFCCAVNGWCNNNQLGNDWISFELSHSDHLMARLGALMGISERLTRQSTEAPEA